MERIRERLKEMTGNISFLEWRDKVADWWFRETGLPFPDDGWMLVEDEIKSRLGEPVEERKLSVILTEEEAKAIAKKLGADEKADDLRTAILEKATGVKL